jgi:hypothetical protein
VLSLVFFAHRFRTEIGFYHAFIVFNVRIVPWSVFLELSKNGISEARLKALPADGCISALNWLFVDGRRGLTLEGMFDEIRH